jgi:murein DD-endopeptidase MepM/ murein hydrolase activator NlpD
MYTFFGSSKEAPKSKLPLPTEGTQPPRPTEPPVVTDPPVNTAPPATDDQPTVKPEKDWMQETLMMPVDGTVIKEHDLLHAVYSATMNDYRVHRGVDIETELGSEVVSVADGTVKEVGNDPFMGTTVTIDHGDGLVSIYKNLSPELAQGIKVGKEISEGSVIGNVGESAILEIADEPHLHFELTLKGEPIDPCELLDVDSDVNTED